MAYSITGKERYQNNSTGIIYEFTCDSVADIQKIHLNKDVRHGSRAIVYGDDLSVSIFILATMADGTLGWRGPF